MHLNTGCVPSKALLAAAKHAHAAQAGEAFGVTAGNVDIDFRRGARAHVRSVIASIAPIDSAERFAGLGVRVIKGHATFKDKRTVNVDGKVDIRARRVVIASGIDAGGAADSQARQRSLSRPTSPFSILMSCRRISSSSGRTDRHGIGAGVPPARQQGHCVRSGAPALLKDDPECASIVCNQLERDGVVLRNGLVKAAAVAYTAGNVTLTIEGEGGEERIEGTHLLVATGRKPTVDGLNLDNARIKYDGHGIRVGKNLKTSNSRVYAIDDCAAGQLQFTHAANYHAGLVIRNALFRLPVKVNNDAVPWVTYTEPELAQTGLTEAEARKRGIKIRILRWSYYDNDRAQAEAPPMVTSRSSLPARELFSERLSSVRKPVN